MSVLLLHAPVYTAIALLPVVLLYTEINPFNGYICCYGIPNKYLL